MTLLFKLYAKNKTINIQQVDRFRSTSVKIADALRPTKYTANRHRNSIWTFRITH